MPPLSARPSRLIRPAALFRPECRLNTDSITHMRTTLFLGIFLSVVCCGFSQKPAAGVSIAGTPSPALQPETTIIDGRPYGRLPLVSYKDASLFVLHGAAADYVEQSYAAFRSRADFEDLYAEGTVDAVSFIIGDERFENIVGGSVLIIGAPHTKAVVGNIGVGAPLKSVLEIWGPPDFVNKDLRLAGYKTERFYIAFRGTETVERIYIAKRNAYAGKSGLIPEFFRTANKNDFAYAARGKQCVQIGRGSMTCHHPGGLYLWYGAGDEFHVRVFRDFTGLVPQGPVSAETYEPSDFDYPEYKIYLAADEEAALAKQFETKASVSPDGNIAAVTYGECTYERSGLLFRFRDGKRPDVFIRAGHYPAAPVWLEHGHVGIDTMHGFGVYDLAAYGASANGFGMEGLLAYPAPEKSAVFYAEYEDAGGPYTMAFDRERQTLRIPENRFTLYRHGEAAEAAQSGDAPLLLHFHYDSAGKLGVEVRNSIRTGAVHLHPHLEPIKDMRALEEAAGKGIPAALKRLALHYCMSGATPAEWLANRRQAERLYAAVLADPGAQGGGAAAREAERKLEDLRRISALEEAALAGDADKQCELAERYYGRGMEREHIDENVRRCIYWYTVAGEGGNLRARIDLGRLFYSRGDLSQAEYWYGKAAAQGSAIGEYLLGNLLLSSEYFTGEESASGRNYERAMELLHNAAQKGNPAAQCDLGAHYLEEGDMITALKWLTLGRRAGSAMDIYYSDRVKKAEAGMSEEEKAKAMRLVEQWEKEPRPAWTEPYEWVLPAW